MTAGVPVDEATARDFIMVRAALVRRVGGAPEALVWSRVYYRVATDSILAYERDGEHWWSASLQTIADETGLTVKQARGAVESLVANGFLVREHHAGYDRTSSYRPVVHLPEGANGIAQNGTFHLPEGANAPLIENLRLSSLEDDESSSKPERRLPRTWLPNDAHRERSRELGVDLEEAVEAFRLHAETHDRRAANWNSAFTTWLKRAPRTIVPGEEPAEDPWELARADEALRASVPWLAVLKISPEEYLERREEPGWVASMENLAAKRAGVELEAVS